MVLLMYRKDYYKDIGVADEKPQGFAKNGYTQQLEENVEAQRAKVGKDPNSVSVVTFSVAKNRNGRTGSITLLFEKAHSRFTSPSLELEQIEAKKNGVNLEDFDEADLATPNKGED